MSSRRRESSKLFFCLVIFEQGVDAYFIKEKLRQHRPYELFFERDRPFVDTSSFLELREGQ